jgi:hypothetical protein
MIYSEKVTINTAGNRGNGLPRAWVMYWQDKTPITSINSKVSNAEVNKVEEESEPEKPFYSKLVRDSSGRL